MAPYHKAGKAFESSMMIDEWVLRLYVARPDAQGAHRILDLNEKSAPSICAQIK